MHLITVNADDYTPNRYQGDSRRFAAALDLPEALRTRDALAHELASLDAKLHDVAQLRRPMSPIAVHELYTHLIVVARGFLVDAEDHLRELVAKLDTEPTAERAVLQIADTPSGRLLARAMQISDETGTSMADAFAVARSEDDHNLLP